MAISLRAKPSVLTGVYSTTEFMPFAQAWRRSKRSQGGDFLGSFQIDTDSPFDLETIFYNYLGYDFWEASNGAPTWQGMIYQMDLTYAFGNGKSMTRRKSLDLNV